MTLPISSAWTRSSTEARRRWDAWNRLGCPDPGTEVKPGDLRRVGLYGGAQGIWVDKQKTVSDSFSDGIAVSVLHTDSAYPDEISEGGARYHYPKTDRPDSRDAGEVEAGQELPRVQPAIVVHNEADTRFGIEALSLGVGGRLERYGPGVLLEF